MPDIHLHLVIHGRVQGVGYRWSMVKEARRLDVRGWVRNRADGTVEAEAAGDAHRVEALAAWALRGPEAAQVERVERREGAAGVGLPAPFEQRPSA